MDLSARFLYWMPVPEGRQARIAFHESNGDEYEVNCLVVGESLQIGGDRRELEYLNERYSPYVVSNVARSTILRWLV
ncbi:MAG: hypothetical protein KF812_08105 [Fimbriimonadaceae bacterium]|nr:hypothetical protein [Fimbriimonadaceae bacterium]